MDRLFEEFTDFKADMAFFGTAPQPKERTPQERYEEHIREKEELEALLVELERDNPPKRVAPADIWDEEDEWYTDRWTTYAPFCLYTCP
jgi:hypothetical protein